MEPDDVLSSRLLLLRHIVRSGFDDAPGQVQGFISRVLQSTDTLDGRSACEGPAAEACFAAVRFDGYPALARAGYLLGMHAGQASSNETVERFLHGIDQQRMRPANTQAQLAGDTLALLGIADGLCAISQVSHANNQGLNAARLWVRELLDHHGGSDALFSRARLLVSDLLEQQGRFGQRLAQSDDTRVAALDLCLYRNWSHALRNVRHPDTAQRRDLFKRLLIDPPPSAGELVHAASWICAFEVLTDEIAAAAVPDANSVARILEATQGSLRRWRWEVSATRKNAMAARWLIDKEPDVQAFLFAVLYPYFGMQLEDEQYLRGFGLRQGRFDFAITGMGLIVEVKVLRTSADVSRVESEIADDLSLYFKEGNPFTSMIVYIYDDRDKPEPEKYPAIQDALRRRSERIVAVPIVRRPSMIPDQDRRSYGEEALARPGTRSSRRSGSVKNRPRVLRRS